MLGTSFQVPRSVGGMNAALAEQFTALPSCTLQMKRILAICFILGGCASKSSDISASYVSPIMYQNHTCPQLAQEAQGVSSRAAQVSGAQDQKRTNDAIATGVAVVVFWPAAFLVGGDGPQAAELANLKGQMNAIEQASIQKRCGIQFQRPS